MCGDEVYGWYGHGLIAYPTQPSMGHSYAGIFRPETKKQRIARIAKEKMYASWCLFNQKTITIINKIKNYLPKHTFIYAASG